MPKFAGFNLVSTSSGAAFAVPQTVDADVMASILGIKQFLYRFQHELKFMANPVAYRDNFKDALKLVAKEAAIAYNEARVNFERSRGPEEAHQRAMEVARLKAKLAMSMVEVQFPIIDTSGIINHLSRR